ncbi:MAG: lytic murein transglycosylase [Thermodesulfobacteriota bacterium]
MKRLLLCILLLSSHFLFVQGLDAAEIQPNLQDLVSRLQKDGIDLQYLTSVFTRPELELVPHAVAKGLVRKEARLNYGQFLENYAVAKATSYLHTHQAALKTAEERFGISGPVIVAILCVETACGSYLGGYTALNLLATQATSLQPDMFQTIYELIPSEERTGLSKQAAEKRLKKKARRAYRELKALLNYAREHRIDPFSILGSAEGAIGIPQFLPSNIPVYGRDGDGDGKIDLFHHEDAIASVASFLKSFRWKEDASYQGKKKVILRYNRSRYYADTVLTLAEKLQKSWH